ncbi:MAG: hypothetical protein AAGG50_12705 [Bacteroidota bacterium]
MRCTPTRSPVRTLLRRYVYMALLLALAVGCKSAEDLFDEGQALEAQGRYAEAAFRYVDSLEKEENAAVRARLVEAGTRAMEAYVAQISAALDADDPVTAADRYRDTDDLLGAAGGVGVALPTFDTYAEDRRATFDAAIDALVQAGADADRAADYEAAIDAYDRAALYDPAPAQQASLDAARAGSYAAWAEAALAAGRFRTAYDRAERALGFAPGDRALLDLQAAILAAGSIRIAAFPTETRDSRATRALPRDFQEALNDRLEDDVWSQPPLFVVATYPPDVRRAIRGLSGGDERYGRRGTSVELARILDANLAVATRVEAFEREEDERKRETRSADRRGGGTATYTYVETDIDLSATLAYEVIEARTRRVLCEGDVDRTVDVRLRTGLYRGNPDDLDLDRNERRLFDEEFLEDEERDLEEALRLALAERLGNRVYTCIERAVP